MGNWRGMLRKGEEGDRTMPQSLPAASPQRGYAVNLLDVVGTVLVDTVFLAVAGRAFHT